MDLMAAHFQSWDISPFIFHFLQVPLFWGSEKINHLFKEIHQEVVKGRAFVYYSVLQPRAVKEHYRK